MIIEQQQGFIVLAVQALLFVHALDGLVDDITRWLTSAVVAHKIYSTVELP